MDYGFFVLSLHSVTLDFTLAVTLDVTLAVTLDATLGTLYGLWDFHRVTVS